MPPPKRFGNGKPHGAFDRRLITALSAHAVQDLVRASLEAGCNAHLAKPVEREELIDAIYRYTVSSNVVKPRE